LQALSQQRLSAQLLDTHSLLPTHGAPFWPLGRQVMPVQKCEDSHSVSLVQLVGQELLAPSHKNPPAHTGSPDVLGGRGLQVPSKPDTSQPSQAAPQALSQQKPSTQMPPAQSLPTTHCCPRAQRVAHAATLPPQSTSVSLPFCEPLQEIVPPHPLGWAPHVLPKAAQLVGAQHIQPVISQTSPAPHWLAVAHSTQAGTLTEPLHTHPVCVVQGVSAGSGGLLGVPEVHTSSVHSLPSTGRSRSSTAGVGDTIPPPSHTTSWQSPASW
jgi:hypothetical protein